MRSTGSFCVETTDLNACADLVRRADPDRFLAAMAAPVTARRVLFPVYAFNVEVARAPWVTAEPMIAEMRLQWWRDALSEIREGGTVRRHEVVSPLAEMLDGEGADLLDQLIVARRWDIYRDPFEDEAHFRDYLDKTAANLMLVAASALGAVDEAPIREAGFAHGLANWLRAIPALERAGRVPLPDGRPEAVRRWPKRGWRGCAGPVRRGRRFPVRHARRCCRCGKAGPCWPGRGHCPRAWPRARWSPRRSGPG